ASFVTACQGLGGWGPLTRRAVAGWLESKSAEDIAFQAVKYGQRQDWRLADMLRLAHPKAPTEQHGQVYHWILERQHGGTEKSPRHGQHSRPAAPIIDAYESAMGATGEDAARLAVLVREGHLPWEAVPSQFARNLAVQAALFESMPPMATIRQLG